MGLYTTIGDIQVKCFSAPCNLLERNSAELNDVKLSFHCSGGKLDYIGKGGKVPYVTYLYNFGKNFAIFDFRTFNEKDNPVIIFIRDGCVYRFVRHTKVRQWEMNDVELWIDNYGEPLNIKKESDITAIVREYRDAQEKCRDLCQEYDKNSGIMNVLSREFREKMKDMPEGEAIRQIQIASDNHNRAFAETVGECNKRWRITEDSDTYKKIHGCYTIGYLFNALTSDNYEEWEKYKAVELLKAECKDFTFEEKVNEFIEWVKTTDLEITEKDMREIFAKYEQAPSQECIDSYLKSKRYESEMWFVNNVKNRNIT